MGTKLPSSAASGNSEGDSFGKEHALIEKHAWQQDRVADFNPTADILRYTTTGADPSIRSKGTQTLVDDLSGLACSVDDFTIHFARKYGAVSKEGDKLFTFYDVEVVSTDRIQYNGDLWFPVNVWYQAETGRCEVQGRIGGAE